MAAQAIAQQAFVVPRNKQVGLPPYILLIVVGREPYSLDRFKTTGYASMS